MFVRWQLYYRAELVLWLSSLRPVFFGKESEEVLNFIHKVSERKFKIENFRGLDK